MQAAATPIIDVLMPVFNGARTVAASLRSVQEQTVRDIRILVIDDGSTDGTPDLVQAAAAEDERIELIRKPGNSGIVDSLNLGFSRCTAPFIARHDADDLSHPHRFAVQLAYLQANADCLAVGGVARQIDATGNFLGTYSVHPSPDRADPHWVPAREPYLMHPFLTVRREAVARVGAYRHVLHAEDTDLYWRLREHGRLHNLPDEIGDYRFHAGSITSNSAHNGMLVALSSQLAAISAARRRSGQADLAFPRERLAEYRAARTLSRLLERGSAGLLPDERAQLRVAVAAKLVDQMGYHLYRLPVRDVRFVRKLLLAGLDRLSPANAEELDRRLASLSVHLLRHGRVAEAVALIPHDILVAGMHDLARRAARKLARLFVSRVLRHTRH